MTNTTNTAAATGWKLVPTKPTPEIMAAAALAVWPIASADDIALARKAAKIALIHMDAAPGVTLDMLAATISTMAPAYRAMIDAAPAQPVGADIQTDHLTGDVRGL